MYAQLGSIVFEILDGLEGFEASRSASLAEQERIGRKPRVSRTGMGLETVTLAIRLHVAVSSVSDRIDEIRAAHEATDPLVLMFGNGRVRGEFTIESVREKWTQTDGSGNLFAAELEVTLKETGDSDKLAAKALAAKAGAKAIKGAAVSALTLASQAAKLKDRATDAQKTMKAAFSAIGKATKMIGLIGKVAQDPSKMGQIGKLAAKIDPHLAQVTGALDTGASVYVGVQAARTSMNRMRTLAANAKTAADAHNAGALDGLSRELASVTRLFSSKMAPLGKLIGVRRA